MHEAEKLSLDQIEGFLIASEGTDPVRRRKPRARLSLDRAGLCQQQYPKQSRRARGLLRRYLEKMTGLSRAQVDTPGWPLSGPRRGAARSLPAPSLSTTLYPG